MRDEGATKGLAISWIADGCPGVASVFVEYGYGYEDEYEYE